jgi:hypothetical protein
MAKKKNRKKLDRLWIGILGGIVVIAIMTLIFLYSNSWEIKDSYKVMKYLLKDSFALMRYALFIIFPNSGFAFLSYRLELWDTYKGFMAMTLVSLAVLLPFMF